MAETNVVSTSQNTDGSWNITGFYHTLTGDAADFVFNVTLTYNSINQVVKVGKQGYTGQTFPIETTWATELGVEIDPGQITSKCEPIIYDGKQYIIDVSKLSRDRWDIIPYTEEKTFPYAIYITVNDSTTANIPYNGTLNMENGLRIACELKTEKNTPGGYKEIIKTPESVIPPSLSLTTDSSFVKCRYDENLGYVIEAKNTSLEIQTATITAEYKYDANKEPLTATLTLNVGQNYESGTEDAPEYKIELVAYSGETTGTPLDVSGWLPYSGQVQYIAQYVVYTGDQESSREDILDTQNIQWTIAGTAPATISDDGLVNYNVSEALEGAYLARTFTVTARYSNNGQIEQIRGKNGIGKFNTVGDASKVAPEQTTTSTTVTSSPKLTGSTTENGGISSLTYLPHYNDENKRVVKFRVYNEICILAGSEGSYMPGHTVSVSEITNGNQLQCGFLENDGTGDKFVYKINDSTREAYFTLEQEEDGTYRRVLHYLNKTDDRIQTLRIYIHNGGTMFAYRNTVALDMQQEEVLPGTTYKLFVETLGKTMAYSSDMLPLTTTIVRGKLMKYVNNVPVTGETIDVTPVCKFESDKPEYGQFDSSTYNNFMTVYDTEDTTKTSETVTVTATLEGYEPTTETVEILFNKQWDEDGDYLKLVTIDYNPGTGKYEETNVTNRDEWGYDVDPTYSSMGTNWYRLYHKENGEWVDITTNDDVAWTNVGGHVSSFEGGYKILEDDEERRPYVVHHWNNPWRSNSIVFITAEYDGKYVVDGFKVGKGNTTMVNISKVKVSPTTEELDNSESSPYPSAGKMYFTARGYAEDITNKAKWQTSLPNMASVTRGVVTYENNTDQEQTLYVICSYKRLSFDTDPVTGVSRFKIKPNE